MRPVVVLASGSDLGKVLLEWHAMGLLDDFVLVDDAGNLDPNSPVRDRRGLSSESLEDLLAREGVDTVYLTVVRPSTAVPTDQLEKLPDRLRRVGVVGGTESLHCTNLLVPRRNPPAEIEWRTIGPTWDRVLIVSPEDRKADKAISSVSEGDAGLLARAAFAASVTTGLMRGTDRPEIEDGQRSTARLIRCFGRIVIGPLDLLPGLRTELDDIRLDRLRLARCVDGIESHDPVGQVTLAAAAFARSADSGAMRYKPYQRSAPPQATEISWREALRMLIGFASEYIKSGIRAATVDRLEQERRRAIERINHLVFGENSEYRLAIGEADRDNVDSLAAQLVRRDHSRDLEIQAHPKLWQEFRRVAFGFVDGSVSPEYMPIDGVNGRPAIVGDPSLVAPLPTAGVLTARTVDGSRLPEVRRSCDPAATKAWKRVLKKDQGPDPSDLDSEQASPAGRDEAAAALEAWEAKRRDAFAYQVATHLDDELAQARLEFETHLERLNAMADGEANGQKTATPKKSSLGRILRTVVAVIALFLPVALLVFGVIGALVAIVIEALALLAVCGSAFGGWLRRLRDRFQEAHRLSLAIWEATEQANEAVHSASEARRLEALYAEVVEWSDAVAYLLHAPFSTPKAQPPNMSSAFTTPLSLSVADSGSAPQRTVHLGARLALRVFKADWLRVLFAEQAAVLNRQLRLQRGEQSESDELDADRDAGAHRHFIADLADAMRTQDRSGLLDAHIERFVEELPTSDAFDPTVTDRDSGHPEPVEQFLSAVVSDGKVPDFAEALCAASSSEILRRVNGKPETWGFDGGAAGTSVLNAQLGRVLRCAFRLDLSEPGAPSDLRSPAATGGGLAHGDGPPLPDL